MGGCAASDLTPHHWFGMSTHLCEGLIVTKTQRGRCPLEMSVRKELQDVPVSNTRTCSAGFPPTPGTLLLWHSIQGHQNHLKIFLNLSLLPWEIISRRWQAGMEQVSPGGADSCWGCIHHPSACGGMIAHSHSGSCGHQAAWQDKRDA